MVRKIGCAILVDQAGRFLLQQRDDISGILQPGKISMFGGHCETGETGLQCTVREIHEELSYFVAADKFELLVSDIGPDIDGHADTLHYEIYVAINIPSEKLVVTEGSLVIVKPAEILLLDDKLTPLTKLGLKAYMTG